MPRFLAAADPEQQAAFAQSHRLPPPWAHEVLAAGIANSFLVGAGLAAVAAAVALIVVRVGAAELARLQGAAVGQAHSNSKLSS